MTGKPSDQPAFMNQAAMKAAGFVPGAKVRIVPETTAFDLPVWTIREKGVVLSLGTKRVKVQLEGGAIYAVHPKDLRLQDTPAAPEPVQEPRQPKDVLDADDWILIQDTLERAAGLEDNPAARDRLRELAAVVQRPAVRGLCSQCDGSPADRWLANGLCPMCYLSNELAQYLPDDFDGDGSQEMHLESGIKAMAEVWEAAKKLREQCEREEAHNPRQFWYLNTPEIRNLMGWMESEDGHFVRYFYAGGQESVQEPPKKPEAVPVSKAVPMAWDRAPGGAERPGRLIEPDPVPDVQPDPLNPREAWRVYPGRP